MKQGPDLQGAGAFFRCTPFVALESVERHSKEC